MNNNVCEEESVCGGLQEFVHMGELACVCVRERDNNAGRER